MVLAITGTVGLETGSRKAVISAGIGAYIAWGIVDGIIYVCSNLLERGESHWLRRRLRRAQGKDAISEQ